MNCLILGASLNQIELIKKVKLRGFFAIVVTPNYIDPGVQLADFHINEDVKNINGIVEKSAQFKIDLCVTDQSDVGALSQARICALLGIPGISTSIVESFCDKYKCYKTIAAFGKRFHPETIYFGSVEDANVFLTKSTDKRSKWIVKPVNSQGSKGVSRLAENDDNFSLLEAMGESMGSGFVLQEYIEGRHFSVDALTSSEHYIPLVIAEKTKYIENTNLDKRLILTSPKNKYSQQKILDFHREVVSTLGLTLGLTHGEYILTKDGVIYLIEIAVRGGGGNISGKVIEYITGFSPQDFLIDSALGKPQEILVNSSSKRCAIIHFFDSTSEIKNFRGLPESLHFEYNALRKSEVSPRDSRYRPGYFIVGGSTLEEALTKENEFLNFVI